LSKQSWRLEKQRTVVQPMIALCCAGSVQSQ
jgi:hypothetical protein